MDNQAKLSAAIAKEGNPAADAAMTGVMNAMGQGGDFSASRMPIKNRINALDVSDSQHRDCSINLTMTVTNSMISYLFSATPRKPSNS